MSIVESIRIARKRGSTDSQILQEIIKQNPEKGKVFDEDIKKGVSPTEILEKIIRQKKEAEKRKEATLAEALAGKEERQRIEEARKRIEALKKGAKEKAREEIAHPEVKEEEKRVEEKKAFKKVVPLGQKRKEAWIREEERRRELLERVRGRKREVKIKKPPPPPPEIIRVIAKKPTLREKLWVRILVFSLVLILLAGISTFWYWYLVIKRQPPLPQPPQECTSDADCPENQICNPEGVCEALPVLKCTNDTDCPAGQTCNPEGVCEKAVVIPPSLFSIENTRTLTISASEELRPLLKQALGEWQSENTFRRIIIKKDNQIFQRIFIKNWVITLLYLSTRKWREIELVLQPRFWIKTVYLIY